MLSYLNSILHKIVLWKFRRYVASQINSGMFVGKNVMITPGVKFDPPHSFLTSIGDNCIIAPDVRFLNHDASPFIFGKFAKIGKIDIKENCFIGAGTILLPNLNIGPNAIVAAGSVVTKDVQPDTVVGGNPARELRKLKEIMEFHQNKMKENGTKTFKSDDFYPKIYESSFQEQIRSELLQDPGYTIGSDYDEEYIFNKE